ncbi:acetylcholine receptor subunit beta-like [Saccostrea cucullata]|uniref:acetylcholine receptor subunit beta-like n=1 Tax=Saccostrea cuccullata TaxID=36930 RepID=UPI002ED2499A
MFGFTLYIALSFTFFCEATNRSQLFKNVIDGHEARVSPYENTDSLLDVSVVMSLMTIREVNEKKQTFAASLWISMTWFDHRLVWNSSHYNGISSLRTKSNYVWTPESVCIINELGVDKCLCEDSDVLVLNTGIVTYTTSRESLTLCELDITKYPFDEQMCSISMANLIHTHENITLNKTSSRYHFISHHNEEWQMLGSHVYQSNVWDPMFGMLQQLHFVLHIQRKSTQVLISIMLPIILLSFINIFCFVLPVESGEKMGASIAIFLTFSVFLTIVNDYFPTTETTPYFIVYMNNKLFLSGLTVIFQAVVLHQHFKNADISQNKVEPTCIVQPDKKEKQQVKRKCWDTNDRTLNRAFMFLSILANLISFLVFFIVTNLG